MKTPVFLLCLIKNLNLKHESSCLLIIYCIFCLSFSWFFPLSWLSSGRGWTKSARRLDDTLLSLSGPGILHVMTIMGSFCPVLCLTVVIWLLLRKKKDFFQLIRAFHTLFCIIVHIFLFYRCFHTCELKAIGWLTGIYVDLWSRPGRKPVWKH